MKVAFVQCRIQPWWATQVLKDIIDHTKFSQATIYTIASNQRELQTSKHNIKIWTCLPSRLNTLFSSTQQKRWKKIFDHRYLIVIAPLCMRYMRRKILQETPQKIILSSFAVAKNLGINSIDTTIYFHSPMQYIRTHRDEYKNKIKGRQGMLWGYIVPYLQKRDKQYVRFDKVYANSLYTAREIKKIYNITSDVIYPCIDSTFYKQGYAKNDQWYYIYIGRLVRFVKELDIIIHAANTLWYPLIIVWSGPDEQYLKAIAHDNIMFVPWMNTDNYIQILKNAKWLINITKESFGIVTAQAITLWVPVLWYNQWATPELINNTNGLLIKDKHRETLIEQRRIFDTKHFDREKIWNNAQKSKNSTFVEF